MKKDLTDITVVLDRSGSMSDIITDTIGGFNTFLKEQQSQPGEALFTLTQFDNEYEIVHDGIDIKKVPKLNNKTYIPRGSTALLDALGRTIISVGNRLSNMNEEDRPEKVIFVILTDGEENDSREFTYEKVNEMINHQRDVYNWDFIFLGANQDAIQTGANLGIGRGCSLTYASNSIGTQNAFKSVSQNMSIYRSSNFSGKQDNYFSDEDRMKQEQAGI